MEGTSSFHLSLPANSNGVEFPENTNSTYKIRLYERLRLDGSKWEIALLDAFYPNNWSNVDDGCITVWEINPETKDTIRELDIKVRTGKYTKLKDLLDEVDHAVRSFKLEKSFNLMYDDVRHRMFLMIRESQYEIMFSKDLAHIFGFKKDKKYSLAELAGTAKNTTLNQLWYHI